MSELALFLVRTGFLVIMWIFVFTLISVIRADLFGQRVVSKVAQANAPTVVSSPLVREAPMAMPTFDLDADPTHLVIIEGPRSGSTIRLDGREITIGRSADSNLLIDDEYASTNHAKLVKLENEWLLQDLGSTNGTYLGNSKVGTPVVLRVGTPVRIGKTVFELRA